MIFHHPNAGRAVRSKSGRFTATDGASIDVGFVPDAVWITDGTMSSDYVGNETLLGAGCNFKEAGEPNLMVGMFGVLNAGTNQYYARSVYFYQNESGFEVAFVTFDNSLNMTDNPSKTYTYHAMKYS